MRGRGAAWVLALVLLAAVFFTAAQLRPSRRKA